MIGNSPGGNSEQLTMPPALFTPSKNQHDGAPGYLPSQIAQCLWSASRRCAVSASTASSVGMRGNLGCGSRWWAAAAVAAETAGFDDVWIAEHYFMSYGICPSAITLAAYLLGATHRITVGTAVSVLSTQHPIAVAEQTALLDQLSRGRFRLRVGGGGVVVALLAVAVATAGTAGERSAAGGLWIAIASGVGFGLFFVALDASPADSGLWPLLAAKAAAVVVLGRYTGPAQPG